MSSTAHCRTGCAIGDVRGMVLATCGGWGDAASIALVVVLAFGVGYAKTVAPVARVGVSPWRSLRIALAADTARSPRWSS
jgi:hypothetical protein